MSNDSGFFQLALNTTEPAVDSVAGAVLQLGNFTCGKAKCPQLKQFHLMLRYHRFDFLPQRSCCSVFRASSVIWQVVEFVILRIFPLTPTFLIEFRTQAIPKDRRESILLELEDSKYAFTVFT